MICTFDNEYRFLSNFYAVNIPYEGIHYPSVEHAYQAAKTTDVEIREALSKIRSAGTVKRYGRAIDLRPDWEDIKIRVMYDLLSIKFDMWGAPIHDATEEAKQLINTYPHQLIEGNWWGDEFWGVNYKTAVGHNWLGRLLMLRRDELRAIHRRLYKEE